MSVALELQDVIASFRLTLFQGIEQLLKLFNSRLGFGLSLGLAGIGRVLQFGARLVQFFLSFAALFFKLCEQFLSISQRLGASVFQMLKQAA